MRLLFSFLAVANLRWARAAVDRSDRLYGQAEEAFAESQRRLALAEQLCRRAHPTAS